MDGISIQKAFTLCDHIPSSVWIHRSCWMYQQKYTLSTTKIDEKRGGYERQCRGVIECGALIGWSRRGRCRSTPLMDSWERPWMDGADTFYSKEIWTSFPMKFSVTCSLYTYPMRDKVSVLTSGFAMQNAWQIVNSGQMSGSYSGER